MNILVTGATGFIGRALIEKLAGASDYDIYGLDNKAEHGFRGNILTQYIQQDLREAFHLDISFDYVFHLGALNVTHVGKEEYEVYAEVNVRGTENLIKAVTTRKFVFMSTVKVYKRGEDVIDEDSPVFPVGDYERSKLEAEEVCLRSFPQEDLIIFRAVNVVGPGQAEKAVIPVFFSKAMRDEPLEIIHPKDSPLQMLYIDDLLYAFSLLLEGKKGGGIINLCSDETITLENLAQKIVDICASKSMVRCMSDEKAAQLRFVSNRAQSLLGWQPRTLPRDILKNYYEFVSVIK